MRECAKAFKQSVAISMSREIETFCPSCGKQVNENDNFCPYCATPLHVQNQPMQQASSPTQPSSPPIYTSVPPKTENISNAWFLVPLIFSIVGGFVAYWLLRKRDPNKAKLMIGVGAIVFIIEILLI